MNSSISIETERLLITTFTENLLTEKYVAWLNDPTVVRNSRQRHKGHTLEECRHYFLSFSRSDNLFLSITLKEGSKDHIGNLTVTMDRINSVADIAILIGDKSAWGNGYGFEAWQALSQWLLRRMGIRKVTGGCYASNEPMIKIMKKAGMSQDGTRQRHVLVDGIPTDIVYFSFFKDGQSS